MIEILQKEARSKDQLIFLKKAFQELKFFREKGQSFNEGLYNLLFRSLKYEFFQQSEVIFHFGFGFPS